MSEDQINEPRINISIRETTQRHVKAACVLRKVTLIDAADEAFADLLVKWKREDASKKREARVPKLAAA